MYYLDLFSGIGGFALGAYWAGWKFDEHYFSEIDKYCVELYKRRFSNAIELGDIRQISMESLRMDRSWILTGGFPCQDISIAGKGEGISGERSGLWFEMWRIIRDLRPRWVIAENVGAITFRGLSTVLNSLAEIGYDAEWQDIRASDMGAPHKRERIWIVAYPQQFGWGQCGNPSGRRNEKKTIRTCEDVAHSSIKREGGLPIRSGGSQQAPGLIKRSSQDVADTTGQGLEGEESARGNRREQGLFTERCGWLTEPDVGRLAHGIPHRVDRLRALGNSIIPQISELLFRRIKCLEEQMQ